MRQKTTYNTEEGDKQTVSSKREKSLRSEGRGNLIHCGFFQLPQ